MTITIQPKDFTAKAELTDFIKEKAEKMFRMYDKIISCGVVLKIDKSEANENKVCDMRFIIPGNDLLASAQCKTFEEAAMLAIGALENKLKRERQKQCNRLRISRCIETIFLLNKLIIRKLMMYLNVFSVKAANGLMPQ
jgi:putative sigma-54 modulation protein